MDRLDLLWTILRKDLKGMEIRNLLNSYPSQKDRLGDVLKFEIKNMKYKI